MSLFLNTDYQQLVKLQTDRTHCTAYIRVHATYEQHKHNLCYCAASDADEFCMGG